MAPPLTPASFISALRAEGLTVVEVGNWRTHNRNSKGTWGPMNGVMVHHTVTKGTASTVELCKDGHSTLPGPLCHGVIGKDGRIYLVGYGRANHAGGGDNDVLNAVIAESYATNPPATHKGEGDAGAADGNSRFYGFECENLGDGNDPWPTAQIEAITRATAALCRAHGWGAKSVIGHLEWSRQKSDPKGFTMASVRTRVAERLQHAANWKPPTTPPKPSPTTIESRVTALEKLVTSQAKRIEALEKKAA